MMKVYDTRDRIVILEDEIKILQSQIREHATGHIHTAISVLQKRLDELNDTFINEQKQRNR